MKLRFSFLVTSFALLTTPTFAVQVDYDEGGGPWNQRAERGPDAEVDGWFYNLGVTGIRVELVSDAPKHLLVQHVFEGSPAAKKVEPGDYIIGVNGAEFETEHEDGYRMDLFGPKGPILDFANALEASCREEAKGKLTLLLYNRGKKREETLKLDRKLETYAETYPAECPKSTGVLGELLDYLIEQQDSEGSWGSPPHDTFAPLALLADGSKRAMSAVEKNVRWHAESTKAKDDSWLINWRYMSAAIVMSEYYLATGKKWVLKELQEVYDFLISTQYVDLSQVNAKVKETHPDDWPDDAMDKHGGWGHNPGFEGYGPISMLTGQGALAFALMSRCGIEIDRDRHKAAYAFLERGTGKNGYLWYADDNAGDEDWADMGRTGVSAIAHWLAPESSGGSRELALRHAKIIGSHPESFPDTHGSPIMGMGYAALAANLHEESFRRLMDANRWWFTLSRCGDGSFYYQPNRDNAGYGSDSRVSATAVTAFIFSIPKRNLVITGKATD